MNSPIPYSVFRIPYSVVPSSFGKGAARVAAPLVPCRVGGEGAHLVVTIPVVTTPVVTSSACGVRGLPT